jgi:hypothetical protein
VQLTVADAPAAEARRKRAVMQRGLFEPKITVCLPSQSAADGACLAYYDAMNQAWICADASLDAADGLLCGETDRGGYLAVVVPPAETTTSTTMAAPPTLPLPDEECEPSIIACFADLYLWIIIGVVGGLVLIGVIVCITCLVRRRQPPAAKGVVARNEFQSSRNSSEMEPMVHSHNNLPPPPPSTLGRGNGQISYAQSSLARKDLEVEFVEEISSSSSSSSLLLPL